MVNFLDFILDFIRIDLIIGFGWYSILFFIFRLFKYKKEFLADFDKNACKTVVFLGILFIAVWLSVVTFTYFGVMENEEKATFIQRLTGPYAFAYFLQPLFWLMLTQLLRIHYVRKILFFRILIVIPFILTFERFIIIVTSFHRDYLPSSWSMTSDFSIWSMMNGFSFEITWLEFLLSIIIKTIEFAIIVFAYKYAKQSILKFKTARVN